MPAIDRLQALSSTLTGVATSAKSTAASVQAAMQGVAQAGAALTAASGSLASSTTALSEASSHLISSSSATTAALQSTQTAIDQAVDGISSSASRLNAEVSRTVDSVSKSLGKLQEESATRLDDLLQLVSTTKNAWDRDVALMIGAVKIGLIPLQELIDKYGDANIQGKRLVEFLDGIPLNTYSKRIQELIDTLAEGTGSIESIKEFLAQSDLQFSQNLLKAIDLFKQGKVTLDYIADLVRNIQKVFPDTQFADLAEALQRGLANGDLR